MVENLKKTPFHAYHKSHGAKMVPFAGYDMPIQYTEGIIKEHEWVRTRAGLFDVSHMGQCLLEGPDALQNMTRLTPTGFAKTPLGKCKYTVLTNEDGGIVDDLIVTKLAEDTFFLVINGACKEKDIAWIEGQLEGDVRFSKPKEDHALIALQGPYAAQALGDALFHGKHYFEALGFMRAKAYKIFDGEIFVSRTGYTGEDGFEISFPADNPELAHRCWELLTQNADVKPIGLGARDSLRLDMGFPLYGQDLTEETSPVEAGLNWIISKKNSNYLGATRIINELKDGPARKRVGIKLTDRGIARDGATILTQTGVKIGEVTSGGFSPTLKSAIAQGYVESAHATEGTKVMVDVRGKRVSAQVHNLTFVNAGSLNQPAG